MSNTQAIMTNTGVNIQNTMDARTRQFRVVISYSEEDKVYYANVPSIEGCMTYGDTVEEAMKHIREAAEGMLEVMIEDGMPIPDDSNLVEYSLNIDLPQLATA